MCVRTDSNSDTPYAPVMTKELSQGRCGERWISLSFKTWGTASSNVGDNILNVLELDIRLRSRPTFGQLPSVWVTMSLLLLVDEEARALPSRGYRPTDMGVILEIHQSTINMAVKPA